MTDSTKTHPRKKLKARRRRRNKKHRRKFAMTQIHLAENGAFLITKEKKEGPPPGYASMVLPADSDGEPDPKAPTSHYVDRVSVIKSRFGLLDLLRSQLQLNAQLKLDGSDGAYWGVLRSGQSGFLDACTEALEFTALDDGVALVHARKNDAPCFAEIRFQSPEGEREVSYEGRIDVLDSLPSQFRRNVEKHSLAFASVEEALEYVGGLPLKGLAE